MNNAPRQPLEEAYAEIERLKQRLFQAEQVGLIYAAFCELRGASQWVLELYWDGSGQIVSNVPVNTVCGWDDLDEARAKIEQLSASQSA